MRLWISDSRFTQRVLNIHGSGYSAAWLLHTWCRLKMLPSRNQVLCTPRNHAPVYSVIRSHVGRVSLVCLVVICVWQNDRDLLRASAVTRGWNRCGNESTQEVDPGEETLEPLFPGLEPASFRLGVRRPTADLPVWQLDWSIWRMNVLKYPKQVVLSWNPLEKAFFPKNSIFGSRTQLGRMIDWLFYILTTYRQKNKWTDWLIDWLTKE